MTPRLPPLARGEVEVRVIGGIVRRFTDPVVAAKVYRALRRQGAAVQLSWRVQDRTQLRGENVA